MMEKLHKNLRHSSLKSSPGNHKARLNVKQAKALIKPSNTLRKPLKILRQAYRKEQELFTPKLLP